MSVKRIRLGDLAGERLGSVNPLDYPDETFDLYSVPAFDSGNPDRLVGSQIGSSKQVVQPNDVLLSKIVPHIRRAWVVKPQQDYRLIASGEWIVFRDERFHPDYLRHCLVGDSFHQKFMQTVAGVGGSLLRARPSAVFEIEVPLPSFDEQKRIAVILDKADLIRRKRQQALRLTDDFLRSVFLDMFGDPLGNPHNWPTRTFGEIVSDTKLGLVRSSEEFGWDLPVPYVRMDAVTNSGGFLPEKVQRTNATPSEITDFGLNEGDFLFNTRNSKELVGKVAIYPGPRGATFNNNLMRVRFIPGVDPYFICHQFQFDKARQDLETRKQGTTSVYAVYWKNLSTMPILVPPPEVQRAFRIVVEKVKTARAKLESSASESDQLFFSLQQRAFSGQL